MLKFLQPAAHIARLPADQIDPVYKKLRWQIFMGIFFGYAAYYLVRKNFALAIPYLQEEGFTKADLGFALSAISIAYGFSKFISGSFSDRSNPRVFLPLGLILSGGIMLLMGLVPWATSSITVATMWSYHGSLVEPKRAWWYRFCLELCSQHRWRFTSITLLMGYVFILRLA